MVGIPGVVVVSASLLAGVGSLVMAAYLDRHRGRGGVGWFVATLGAEALWSFAYGVGLLVFDPLWRAIAEALVWIGMAWLGPLFLTFALVYTGRSGVVSSRSYKALFVVPVAATGLALAHPVHDLLWVGFRLSPVFGLATVEYAIQPLGDLVAVGSIASTSVAVLLLSETIVSYGPLYRREAFAVTLSTLPPAVGVLLWLTGAGPWPPLNLTTVLFVPHLAFDAYAFVGTHMFETNPTTQRAAERSALEDLEDPLLVVDPADRVVNLSRRASELFDVPEDALPTPLVELTDGGVEALEAAGEIELGGPAGGVYAVSVTPLTDQRDDPVGSIVVLYDITRERQREQQLSVVNRVLRHNLRNEMTVVRGWANAITEEASEESVRTRAGTILDASDRILSTARKAQEFERIQDRSGQALDLSIADLLDDVVDAVHEEHPVATVERDVRTRRTSLRTDPGLLTIALANLVENAVHHGDDGDATATVRVEDAGDGAVAFEVRDDNERIPEIEVATLTSEGETPLQHGQGIGLWLVHWCVRRLHGDLSFGFDGGNVVTVTVPAGDDGPPPNQSQTTSGSARTIRPSTTTSAAPA